MWVYIPWWFATQWPAPDGFHVPTKDEWGVLCGILTSTFWLASNATTMGTYLKMPMAWRRWYNNANVDSVGSGGLYWSSSKFNANNSYFLYFDTRYFYPQNDNIPSNGYSVRCFKNKPTIPTSSWTTLYQGSWNAWVFYNATDWLISVSGDGTNWYTIMDKNLWATTVFNQWDTVNDANSWYFYQRGNNYWFPHSWSVTTSSTQVDASTYWPWNYYNSSTFITRSSSPYRWDTTDNANLWWWEDGNVPMMSELKNAYIGEYRVPWANTIAYYPLETNANDFSGNNRNWTGNSMSYTTDWTIQVANFNWGYITLPTVWTLNNVTVNLWFKSTQTTSWEFPMVFLAPTSDNKNLSFALTSGLVYVYRWNGSSVYSIHSWDRLADWQWHNITTTINSTTQTLYADGVLKSSGSCNYAIERAGRSALWKNIWNSGNPIYRGYMSNVIIENKARTADEISNYYNSTKSKYWL